MMEREILFGGKMMSKCVGREFRLWSLEIRLGIDYWRERTWEGYHCNAVLFIVVGCSRIIS